jgi:hypothetical protein
VGYSDEEVERVNRGDVTPERRQEMRECMAAALMRLWSAEVGGHA